MRNAGRKETIVVVSVAVACGVRLSCSVLLGTVSVSLVARALSIALHLQVHTKGGNIMICIRAARPHGQSV